LEIDPAALEQMARDVDAQARATPDPVTKSAKRVKVKSIETTAGDTVDLDEEERPIDPEFNIMVIHGTDQCFDWAKARFRLMEPGETTRQKTGLLIAKLLDRLQPMEPGPWAEAATVLGYLSLWALMGRLPEEKKPNADDNAPAN